MISIIIPVYNQASKLIFTLKSINKQTYKDFEIIIINDGSHDHVEDLFSNYYKNLETNNKYLFLNQSNKGAPSARNRGLRHATGEYILFCDADAILKPDFLKIMLEVLENSSFVSYVYSSFKWGHKLFKPGSFDEERLKKMPYIHTMSLIRHSDLPNDPWDESIKKLQDWDLWLMMLLNNKIGLWVPRVLFTVSPGGHISTWLPAFTYKLFPFLPLVKKYNKAVAIIKKKYGL